jgi:hypothetical protein
MLPEELPAIDSTPAYRAVFAEIKAFCIKDRKSRRDYAGAIVEEYVDELLGHARTDRLRMWYYLEGVPTLLDHNAMQALRERLRNATEVLPKITFSILPDGRRVMFGVLSKPLDGTGNICNVVGEPGSERLQPDPEAGGWMA